jgi:predicted Zn finger-like uncharacterized protein
MKTSQNRCTRGAQRAESHRLRKVRMRITCPVCSANYEVPDQMLGAGRKVRCGKCGHQWAPGPTPVRSAAPPPRPAPAPSPESPPRANLRERLVEVPRASPQPQPLVMEPAGRIRSTVPDDPAYQVTERRSRPGVLLGWVASVLVWGLVIWAAYAYRAEVMSAWPPSQRLYVALGLGPGS